MYIRDEVYSRVLIVIVISIFYSFIFSFYALDFIDFIVIELVENFSFEIMLTQVEDLTTLVFNLVNILLLIFLSPMITIQLFLFFRPALFQKEFLMVRSLGLFFLIIFFFSFFFSFFSIFIFFYLCSSQLLDLNLGVSAKILIDFKKNFFFICDFYYYFLFIFLPLNCLLVFSCFYFKNMINRSFLWFFNFFCSSFLFLSGFFDTFNYSQLFFLYSSQFLQLEFVVVFFLLKICYDKFL